MTDVMATATTTKSIPPRSLRKSTRYASNKRDDDPDKDERIREHRQKDKHHQCQAYKASEQ